MPYLIACFIVNSQHISKYNKTSYRGLRYWHISSFVKSLCWFLLRNWHPYNIDWSKTSFWKEIIVEVTQWIIYLVLLYPVCIVRHLTNNNYPRFRFHSDNHYEKNLILPTLGYISANFIDLKLIWYNHIFLFIIRNIILSKQVKFLTSITEVSFLSSIFLFFHYHCRVQTAKWLMRFWEQPVLRPILR